MGSSWLKIIGNVNGKRNENGPKFGKIKIKFENNGFCRLEKSFIFPNKDASKRKYQAKDVFGNSIQN